MRVGREFVNKISLLTAFVVGICGVMLLKWYSYPILWTIGWPICTIIVYCLIMRAANDNGLYEIIGDNCYYLGFVFTLTSLSVTLYLLYGADNTEAQDQLPEVISGFGVALSSTIAGIVLRVLMLRMAPDIAQQESEARVDLDLAVRDFRTHLGMSIGELKRYSVETSQVLAEQRDAIQEALAQDTEAHKRATEASTVALTKFSEDTEKKLADHRAALQESMEQNARQYREAVQEGIAAFREALDRVSATLSDPETQVRDALRRSVDNQLLALESGATGLRRVLEHTVESFAQYREEADRLASLSREIFGQTEESAKTARNELESLKELTESITALSNESHGLDAVLSGLVGKLGRVEDGIATTLEPAVARIGEGASAISATLADSSGKLKSAAERFEAAAERTAAADMQTNIAGAAEHLSDAVERLETVNTALATAIEKLGDPTERTAEPWRTGILDRVFSPRSR